jgi:hypothetical protein
MVDFERGVAVNSVKTNLRIIKRTYRHPLPGDVFVMQLPNERYLCGRVVLADPSGETSPTPEAYLIYVYRHQFEDKRPDYSLLRPDQLLIPPEFINRLPWTKGYFETISHCELTGEDLLRQHCFLYRAGVYVDERGRVLPCRVEPCGEWGLGSYRMLDDLISDALGIPRVPIE